MSSSLTARRACIAAGLLLAAACSSTSLPEAMAPAGTALAPGELDRLIQEHWRAAGVTPSPPAEDLEYLRRVTLDLVGRPPTRGEILVFNADTRPNKRGRTVDRLLASHEFGEHWADLYADLLWHENGKFKPDKNVDPRQWFVDAFNANLSYDSMAYALLAGGGDPRENGAVHFMRTRLEIGGPEALASAATRVFLGLQIQCAQCHDHPYDPRWKQLDFWGMVGYFAGTYIAQAPGMEGMMGDRTLIVRGGFGEARMPTPDNMMAESVAVPPRFLGYNVRPKPGEMPRRTFVRAMLETDLFAKAMVGRTWSELFGHGIVDPWDDLGGVDDPKHPALLRRLAEDFRASGYNIKRLIEQIVTSTAYARSSAPAPGAPTDPEHVEAAVRAFARAGMRPLTPEQLFGTLATVTGAQVKARHRARNAEKADQLLFQVLREYRFTFDDDENAEANKFDGSMPQQLLLLNGELTNEGVRVGPEGVLGGILRLRKDPGDRVDEMMMAAYTRKATPEEKAAFTEQLANAHGKSEARAYEDLFFALLMSTEAVTNH